MSRGKRCFPSPTTASAFPDWGTLCAKAIHVVLSTGRRAFIICPHPSCGCSGPSCKRYFGAELSEQGVTSTRTREWPSPQETKQLSGLSGKGPASGAQEASAFWGGHGSSERVGGQNGPCPQRALQVGVRGAFLPRLQEGTGGLISD